MAKKDDRFLPTCSQGNAFGTHQQIWVDKQTGVNDLFVTRAGYAGGLTPLLKADGTPVVTPVSRCDES